MALKQFRVMREAREHDRFLTSHPEYQNGYRIYMVESNNTSYSRQTHFIVTREHLGISQYLNIDEDNELEPVRASMGSANVIQLGNYRLLSYRPANTFEEKFRIVAHALDGEPVEKFGSHTMDRSIVTMYDAERHGTKGYPGQLVRIFSKASYSRGMEIPANETISLPRRPHDSKAHYYHDTDGKTYKDRVWRALKSFF